MTQQLVIQDAVVALLKVEPAIAGGRVYRNRARTLSTSTHNAVVVRIERSASQLAQVQGGRTSWSTLIAIDCYGRDTDGALLGSTADLVVEGVFARLDADSSLGGLAMDVEPLDGETLAWDVEELETGMACITARFFVKHQTTGRTLTL